MKDTLRRLFHFKAWADDELLINMARLQEEAPATQLMVRALSHSHIVDRIFMAHLKGASHAYQSANLAELPGLSDLAASIRASDHEYVNYVARLGGDQLAEMIDFSFTDGAPGRMSREEMLLHVITHGVGHRGQISAVMLLNALPPASDGFATYLHQVEAAARRRAA